MMSDNNNGNLLGRLFRRLLGYSPQGAGPANEPVSQPPAPPPAPPAQELPQIGGLTPLDLLSLPADQSKLVNWLTRQQGATMDEIEQGLGLDPIETARILEPLQEAGFVRETLVDNVVKYSVIFRASTSKRRTSTLDKL